MDGEENLVFQGLVELALLNLNKKQKSVLLFLATQQPVSSATVVVDLLAVTVSCSRSTVWNHLRTLRKLGLIGFGTNRLTGGSLTLTKLGQIISVELAKYGT